MPNVDLFQPLRGKPLQLWTQVAMATLWFHAAASVFSGVAFGTFLIEPYPAFLLTPGNVKVLSFGLAFGGQLTVVAGAIAGIAFLATRIGWRATLPVFAVVFVLSLGAELAGTHTGFPFGPYGYTTRLGYKILDLVPFNIPTSWFYMLVGCLALCGRLLPTRDDNASKWWWAFMAGVFLTAWDVSMDPAMVKTQHWLWYIPDNLRDAGPVAWFFGHALFYGMPLTNWLGWLLTGIVIARVALAMVPPSVWTREVAPSRFPLVLYAVNGVLPLAVCFRQGMVPAGILGTLAMGVPLWLAWRAEGAPARVTGAARGPVAAAGD